MTTRELISSLQLALKKTFDDADISMAQIAFWVSYFVNKYNTIKLANGSDNGMYLSVFTNVPLLTSTVSSNPSLVANRKYFILPQSVLDLPNDGGVAYVSYNDFTLACQPSFAGVVFDRTTPMKARLLYYDDYTKPSPKTPAWYMVSNYIYTLGLECVDLADLEVGLYTSFNPLSDCGIDNNIQLDPALVSDVYKEVLSLGRFVMLIPESQINDATDATDATQGAVPTQKLVSVNPEATPQE